MNEETTAPQGEWQGYALTHFEFDQPNAYRAELGRLLTASDGHVARALEDEDAGRLGELRAYRKQLRELLAWPGYGFAPEIPKPPGYSTPTATPTDRVDLALTRAEAAVDTLSNGVGERGGEPSSVDDLEPALVQSINETDDSEARASMIARFREELNALNNKKLRGVRLDEESGEQARYDELLALMDYLARIGDRS